MILPVFPETRPIELKDKAAFDDFFKRYPPEISEFTFTNLFAWRNAYRFFVSTLDECLLVISYKDNKALKVYDPIGDKLRKKEAIKKNFNRKSTLSIRQIARRYNQAF